MLNVFHSLADGFCSFIFLFQFCISFRICLSYTRVLFPCNFLFLMWLLVQILHLFTGGLYFLGYGLPYSFSCTSSDSTHIVYIALQTIALMPHRMAFHLTDTLVVLHLDNSTAKAYSCNQHGTASLTLAGQACSILNLTEKHGFTTQAYIPTHLKFGSQLSILGKVRSRVASSSAHYSGSISTAGGLEN